MKCIVDNRRTVFKIEEYTLMEGILELGFEYEYDAFLGWNWRSIETYDKVVYWEARRYNGETSKQPRWRVVPAKRNFFVAYEDKQKYYVDNIEQLKDLMKKKNDAL